MKSLLIISLMAFTATLSAAAVDITQMGSVEFTVKNEDEVSKMTLKVSSLKIKGASREELIQEIDLINKLPMGRITANKDASLIQDDIYSLADVDAQINRILDENIQKTTGGLELKYEDTIFLTNICSQETKRKLFKKAVKTSTCSLTFNRRATYNLK